MSNHKNRRWFVSYGNEFTNRVVCDLEGFNPDTDFKIGINVEDVEDYNHKIKVSRQTNLAEIKNFELIQRLQQHRSRLSFKIFIQDSPGGKIYRWPGDLSKPDKATKIKTAAKMKVKQVV